MNISITKEAKISHLKVTHSDLLVLLQDGREVRVPLVWFPKLLNATAKQRNKFRFIGDGIGIHWSELDEDISIAGILAA